LDRGATSLASFTPLVREEFSNLAVGHRGQALQHIREILLWIYPIPAATLDDGVDHGATPTRVRVPDEEPSAFSDRGRSHVVFNEV
jgi:hypothetical protein